VSSAEDGRYRAVIERVRPEVDCGRFPIKRAVGERVVVEADAFTDGHDQIVCLLLHRESASSSWTETQMQPIGNDRWRGEFPVTAPGRCRYTVVAWVDRFLSWRHDFARRVDPADIDRALAAGAELVSAAAERAAGPERARLEQLAAELTGSAPLDERRAQGLDESLLEPMLRRADRSLATEYGRELEVVVDRPLARFSAWYELFPRSLYDGAAEHGTFEQMERRFPYIAAMGFDVVYLPPIHPIGEAHRKGPNNTLVAGPADPGSPWAIGSKAGGHTAVHPELGTIEDFRRLVAAAAGHGLELALDIAFQCAPDHPYVEAHPQWFRHRPDGTIQHAENPPKKYEDIYPFDFESEDWQALWTELERVVSYWIEQGVTIFRVDNPHTKPFAFWEWLIGRIKSRHPEVIFLSEAFTRPRVMHRLAKLGFTQSYTYFTWRNTKQELTEYLTELSRSESREYFRPNLWPNTPDILHEYLQFGGRPAFISRLVLAATLGASYGIYGPPFELLEAEPRDPGTEEYLDSEKYQIRSWNVARSESLKDLIARVNRIRRENEALQSDWNLSFHPIDNEQLIAYSKATPDLKNIVLVIVNLDPHHRQSGFVEVPLAAWDVPAERPYQLHDLLADARYLWHGERNYVELDPRGAPAHVFRLRRRVAREQDFDYFM
jgi:starch synthase (maltosyl-transferring)